MGRKRQLYLDWIKVGGAGMIVMLHTMSNTMNAGGFYVSDFRIQVWYVLHQFLFTAVPLFIMATGAGFLSTGRSCGYRDMGRHIARIVCCILFFGTLFYVVRMLVERNPFGPADLILAIFQDNTWSHMWYLYRLLGLYFFIPLLWAFMNVSKLWEQAVFAGLLLFFASVYPYVCGMIGFIPARILPVSGTWLFCALAGGILGGLPVEKMRKYRGLILAGIMAGLGGVVWEGMRQTVMSEEHPFLLLLAISLFAQTKLWCDEKESFPGMGKLAGNMLGVYIIHPVFIHICVKVLRFNPQLYLPVLTVPLTAAAIYALSVATVCFLRKIPIVRRCLL